MATLDKSGRILIPQEFRRKLGWQAKDEIAVIQKGNSIVLRKIINVCLFCDAFMDLVKLGDYFVCRDCIDRLKEAKNGEVLYCVKH